MITITRTTRAVIVAITALAVAAPTATAKPIGPLDRTAATTATTYQGTYRPANDKVALSPDRGDKVGTLAQVTNIHAIPFATTKTVSQSSFDWTSAMIGAGFVLAAGLIGAGALGLRGRGRMALGV